MKQSFRPSYKGWKPPYKMPEDPGEPCFRPSYKGWKLLFLGLEHHGLEGFRPSYKGWKQSITKGEIENIAVLDLPIRDGNPFPKDVGRGYFRVLDLPIRDGNFYIRRLSRLLRHCFRPSYKGWKLNDDIPVLDGEITF